MHVVRHEADGLGVDRLLLDVPALAAVRRTCTAGGLGLLTEPREPAKATKRHLPALTDAGRAAALQGSRADEPTEIRDLAVLKLFFGKQAEPQQLRALADRAAAAIAEIRGYERSPVSGIETHERKTLEMGLRFERNAISYWEEVAEDL